jgi:hypothetical protein
VTDVTGRAAKVSEVVDMWREVGCPAQGTNARRVLAWPGLAAFLMLLVAGPALGQTRDHVFEWLAPPESHDAYTLYLGQSSRSYNLEVPFGLIAPDGDGVTRATVALDESLDYYVAATASNQGVESGLSNELFIAAAAPPPPPPSTCNPALCDDGNSCTGDTCDAAGCINTVLPNGTGCGGPDDVCLAGTCTEVLCGDGDVCNGTETRAGNGTCQAGTAPVCGVATHCADPICDAVDGCMMMARPDGLTCDDGNPNTESDRCEVGWCVGDPVVAGPCATGNACPQSKLQGKCMTTITRDMTKVAKAKSKSTQRCIKDYFKRGTSVLSCLFAHDRKVAKAVAKTGDHMIDRCMASPPDFGATDADMVTTTAVAGEADVLISLFAPDPMATLADAHTQKKLATCQQQVFKAAAKCQASWYKEFASCESKGLKDGSIASEESLGACLGADPKGRVAKACGRIGGHVLPKRCAEVDLRVGFPSFGTDDRSQLASEIRDDVSCRVCTALRSTHGLPVDCGTCD